MLLINKNKYLRNKYQNFKLKNNNQIKNYQKMNKICKIKLKKCNKFKMKISNFKKKYHN